MEGVSGRVGGLIGEGESFGGGGGSGALGAGWSGSFVWMGMIGGRLRMSLEESSRAERRYERGKGWCT